MKYLLLLLVAVGLALGGCATKESGSYVSLEARLKSIESDISEIRDELGLYHQSIAFFETRRLSVLESRLDSINEYLNFQNSGPNFIQLTQPPKPKIEQLAEKVGYVWREESKEEGFYKKESK